MEVCTVYFLIPFPAWLGHGAAGQKGNKRYGTEWQRPTSFFPPFFHSSPLPSVSQLSSDKKCSISDPGQVELIGDPQGSTSCLPYFVFFIYGMIIDAVLFTRDKFSHVMSSASIKIPYVDFLGQVMKDT